MPFVGKPKPIVTWKKIAQLPAEGEPVPVDAEEIELENHVTVRHAVGVSTLFIRSGFRDDSGCYVMRKELK